MKQLSMDIFENGSLSERLEREPGLSTVYMLCKTRHEAFKMQLQNPQWGTAQLKGLPPWIQKKRTYKKPHQSLAIQLAEHASIIEENKPVSGATGRKIATILSTLERQQHMRHDAHLQDSNAVSTKPNQKLPAEQSTRPVIPFRLHNNEQKRAFKNKEARQSKGTKLSVLVVLPNTFNRNIRLDTKILDVDIARTIMAECVQELRFRPSSNVLKTLPGSKIRAFVRVKRMFMPILIKEVPNMKPDHSKSDGAICAALCLEVLSLNLGT